MPQVVPKPLSHLIQLGLIRNPNGPTGEIDLLPRRLCARVTMRRDLAPAQIVNESKRVLPGFVQTFSKGVRHQPPDLRCPVPLLGSRSRPTDRLAFRFGSELVEQEVVFPQGEVVMLPIPTEQSDQLLFGQQVPVLADHGDVDAAELFGGQGRLMGKAHRLPQLNDLIGGGSDDPGHASCVGQFPVSPDELMEPTGEVGLGNGSREVPIASLDGSLRPSQTGQNRRSRDGAGQKLSSVGRHSSDKSLRHEPVSKELKESAIP